MPSPHHQPSRGQRESEKIVKSPEAQQTPSIPSIALHRASATSTSPNNILALQRLVGNQAVQRMIQRPSATNSPMIQRKVTVKDAAYTTLDDAQTLWGKIENHIHQKYRQEAKTLLEEWVTAPEVGSYFSWTMSQNRVYAHDRYVARALKGEIRSARNLKKENKLAQNTVESDYIKQHMGTFMAKVKLWCLRHQDDEVDKKQGDQVTKKKPLHDTGRYSQLYYSPKNWIWGDNLITAVNKSDVTGSVSTNAAILADVSLAARDLYKHKRTLRGLGDKDEMGKARGTHWNTNEGATWTKRAREHKIPLSAGPSATTANLMNLARKLKATKDEKIALAWSIFAFWNRDYSMKYAGTHRFHEVMAVAAEYGVPYTEFVYPKSVPDAPENIEALVKDVNEEEK